MLKWLPKLPVIFHNITRFSPVSPYVITPHTISQSHFSFALQASGLTYTYLSLYFSHPPTQLEALSSLIGMAVLCLANILRYGISSSLF